MRNIEKTTRFRQDLKRESRGRHRHDFEVLLFNVLKFLAQDLALPPKFKDHPLKGNLQGFRECHIKPDLILIYRKSDSDSLELVRLGSHSELGLG